ncbi:MAG: MerR family transcriptional regulator [Geobacter sp.]|nr:MerR family transcriptional regulator [Geobacter sp.]
MHAQFSISDIERETGIAKDTLRIWERRYGFPLPQRTATGERRYSAEQRERLVVIRQLLDAGLRPGALTGLGTQQLRDLMQQQTPQPDQSTELEQLLTLLRDSSENGLRHELERLLQLHGLGRFLTQIIAPLNHAVGQAWADGQIGVFDEHIYAEQVRLVVSNALLTLQPAPQAPRVLLTTLPGEQHGLGMLMAACMVGLAGAHPLVAGVQTPLDEIVRGAVSGGCSVVGISCSSYQQRRTIASQLVRLRSMLPAEISLWVGGGGSSNLPQMPKGITLFSSLDQISEAITQLTTNS